MKSRLSTVFTTLRLCLVALFFSVLASCQGTTKRIPGDRFQEVLRDLFITDLILERDGTLTDMADSLLVYPPIFEKHGYTSEQFLATMDYYSRRPARFKSLLSRLHKSLIEERTAYNKQLEYINRQKVYAERFNRWLQDSLTDRRAEVQKRALLRLLATTDTTGATGIAGTIGTAGTTGTAGTIGTAGTADTTGATVTIGATGTAGTADTSAFSHFGPWQLEPDDLLTTGPMGDKAAYRRVLPVLPELPDPEGIPMYLEMQVYDKKRIHGTTIPVLPRRQHQDDKSTRIFFDEPQELEEKPVPQKERRHERIVLN